MVIRPLVMVQPKGSNPHPLILQSNALLTDTLANLAVVDAELHTGNW